MISVVRSSMVLLWYCQACMRTSCVLAVTLCISTPFMYLDYHGAQAAMEDSACHVRLTSLAPYDNANVCMLKHVKGADECSRVQHGCHLKQLCSADLPAQPGHA